MTSLKQSIPTYIPNRTVYVTFTKDTYKNVHRTSIPNSPTLGTAQMSIYSRMGKCGLLYSSVNDYT